MSASFPDEAIRQTDNDAATSRLSAVNAGYLHDEFAEKFVRRPVKRPPIINRGTYCRMAALNMLIDRFLEDASIEDAPKQIVSLGAGTDTRFMLLKVGKRAPKKYFEIDFPEVTAKKAAVIKRHWWERLFMDDASAKIAGGGTEIHAAEYALISGDLRQWDTVVVKLESQGFNTRLPTLVISECVLIYLEPAAADTIVQWIARLCPFACFALYEQILPDDPFGAVMLQNLRARGIELKGIRAYPTLASQRRRFLDRGWSRAGAVDIQTIHDRVLDPKEIKRLNKIEMLDELEEWNLLGQHYCVAWAVRAPATQADITPDEEINPSSKSADHVEACAFERFKLACR